MLKDTYDGDKLAVTLLMTEEANEEALNFLKDPQAVFTLDGQNYRAILNKESISGLYGLTLDSKNARPIPEALAKELIEAQDIDKMCDYILDTYEDGKVVPSKYKIESPCIFEYKNKKYNTTLGRALFNYTIMSIIDGDFVNDILDKKAQSKILKAADDRCLEEMKNNHYEYFTEVFLKFLNKWEEFVFVCADLFSPSIDMRIYATSDEYDKFRHKLIEDNKEAIANGDLEVYDKMESELTKKFKETNKADTRIFDSGSKLSYGGDLRNGLICVGPMPIGVGAGKYAISMSSLVEGTTKEERHLYAQSNIVAGYFRAMGPAVGGEIGKEIMAAFHDVRLDKAGSDCGRTVGQWYTIDNYFVDQLDLRYMIKSGGGVEQLTSESLKTKYFGKTIQVRSVHFCKAKTSFCSICAGEKPYIIARDNEVNIGAQKSKTGDEITQASLSKFHSSKTEFKMVDFNDYIVPAGGNYDIGRLNKNLAELFDIFRNLDHFMKINEASDEFMDEVIEDIDEILDDVIIKNPDAFDDLLDKEYVMDIHKLSVSKEELAERLTYFCKYAGVIIKSILNTFSGSSLFNNDNLTVLNTVECIVQYGVQNYKNNMINFLNAARSSDDMTKPTMIAMNDDPEYKFYRLYLSLFKVNKKDILISGDSIDSVKEKLTNIVISLNSDFCAVVSDNFVDDKAWEFSMNEDDDSIYLFAEPHCLILDTEMIKLDDSPEEVEIEEGVILDNATKNKMFSKIKSSNNSIRRRFEDAIKQAVQSSSKQKERARKSVGENLNEKSGKLDAELKKAKDEYRKTLSKAMQDFEASFIKRNNFKLLKMRNKLNFIYNKKRFNIESQLNENIKALNKKMHQRIHEAEDKIKDKYGYTG